MIRLVARKRDIFGKKVKRLRKEGLVPVELYGHGLANLHLSVPLKDLLQTYKEVGEHSVLQLEVDGELRPVLIHSLEKNHLEEEILAVDFYEVRMDEKVKAHIPLEFQGEPPAVKEKGGILVKNIDEIEVEALPGDLPKSIIVDLSRLTEIDQSIYLKDLPKNTGYDYLVDEDTVLVSVTAPREEEVEVIKEVAEEKPEAVSIKGETDEAVEAKEEKHETEA